MTDLQIHSKAIFKHPILQWRCVVSRRISKRIISMRLWLVISDALNELTLTEDSTKNIVILGV